MSMSYESVMSRKTEIMRASIGIEYDKYELEGIGFDYEGLMSDTVYHMEEITAIQRETGVGNTPLVELKNITRLVREISEPGKGARIFLKDEAANPSGSFKDRRASISVARAKELGYRGVIAATSGNYGAAVASQAMKRGLKCIVIQECYDSTGTGQPEILEKARACEAYGAEVAQLTVGPELFYYFLILLEETGYFNASLYTPFAIAGIESLGFEIAQQSRRVIGKDPDFVLATHAGGGNLTGTARGLIKAGADKTGVIGVSVDLSGLHMASDRDFNRKSFTTGHTGFGIPFAVFPDRSDVPRNAARPLRYMDRYLLVKQGEVFYVTEMLARLEGLQRGPAGNTSLTAAIALAKELPKDSTIVVQETEYTGAGKAPSAQLTFARKNGVKVIRGDPLTDDVPGKVIAIPENPSQIMYTELGLDRLRESYIRELIKRQILPSERDLDYLAQELRLTTDETARLIKEVSR
ncbi:MAG TPA: 2-amino-4-oxopentanoate thiolase subunit OrtB [Mesotoga infera]|uniref:Pyridoxal-5'-phosphate-dependent protein beta subunit n=2 Tax=Mesotoga infera TaxID=1236046 RepID=A0A7Z7PRQ8_9BACT|nr:2-amino-4-oxopentanoate thiolase subunit OrtB [Mesotoga infera]HRR43909.1 2-amino-4-oxopentanoate thiolase subunit OrtB [Mesotoga sp.]SSC13722.1 Pyridoxal-5'-phosphate-dependent protein beta subunit [Mesotoga infera]HON27645.1 2-amino-4-oxopentanoate thiolase subunit OrtB [Mesotoga infera]HPD37703.1 2-amino-4-oxopentanoate thiolase subunit OrtB [Mesotoga infera]HRV01291.1 2-amino-4-oxopentanoate thiolase subunit OrtB [Mesotoga sp.]